MPHLFGTRRIGPDLLRVGLKYSDEWHYAHFWNPRMLSPDLVMAPYRGLFDTSGRAGGHRRRWGRQPHLAKDAEDGSALRFRQQAADQTDAEFGRAAVRAQERARQGADHSAAERRVQPRYVQIAAETEDLEALVAYVQKLGMNRGKWRDLFEPQQLEVMDATLPRSEEWILHGKEVYERRCLGCHGKTGDGNGPAATFLFNQRPRNFNAAVFKFRLTKEPLPTDGDLLRTITRGVRGTAMPAWYELPAQ